MFKLLKLMVVMLMAAVVAAAVSALISGGMGKVRKKLYRKPSEDRKEEETED